MPQIPASLPALTDPMLAALEAAGAHEAAQEHVWWRGTPEGRDEHCNPTHDLEICRSALVDAFRGAYTPAATAAVLAIDDVRGGDDSAAVDAFVGEICDAFGRGYRDGWARLAREEASRAGLLLAGAALREAGVAPPSRNA